MLLRTGMVPVEALELVAPLPVETDTAFRPIQWCRDTQGMVLDFNMRIYQMVSSGWRTATGIGFASVLFMLAPAITPAAQDSSEPQRIEMDLGDYQFHPNSLSIVAGTSAELMLTNRDSFIPHNFIVEAPEAGMDVNMDVPNGESVTIMLRPTRPGTYTFYCDEQFLFFESHREKGMEGQIEVTTGSG
jgi:plastocyanin